MKATISYRGVGSKLNLSGQTVNSNIYLTLIFLNFYLLKVGWTNAYPAHSFPTPLVLVVVIVTSLEKSVLEFMTVKELKVN